jgi:hypothetical protein
MEKHSLVGARDPENVTDLVARHALDVAEYENLLLNWRQ